MTKSEAKNRVDAVHIGELTMNNLLVEPMLEATFALCETESGIRFGRGTRNIWSDETREKILELLASMERDIIADLFVGEGATTTDVVVSEKVDSL